ncbi:helix-turn-helix domain-containing protein [Bacillus velezensis]|uniref:helix-turn-helix domain-containing protein n=1 Tax=Bacillus velezensis TaxID=492670 RepID=UPI002DBD1FF0|nr:helix-turn-helix domain-containing protein [Bacillus velezensis]MEC3659205.1 helix-turn-helix domain-containing protein [Bacillus velezensis]MEC3685443.1 helix-turn-helix domain-containing protein [Bacillus velezensis]MEC3788393.1 helix-turn-helix domain-containing protein [Bacillus velezensis]MEC3849975.1 helix-turn-helix domain-containing protein [Bacillus velezensis]
MYTKEASKMASFRSVDELNGAIRTHIYRNKSDLTPAAIEVLKVLSRHAVKTPGVAYLKLASIAELIGRHRVTVIRAVKRLVDLGIIRKEIKYRPISGGNGANMYVILPATDVTPSVLPRQEAEEPTEAKPEAPERENEAVISQSKLKFLQNTYAAFKSAVNMFVSDRKLTSKLYGIYLAHTSYLKGVYAADILQGIGLESVRQTFIATKRKPIRNLAGYFNGVLDRMLDGLFAARFDSLTPR